MKLILIILLSIYGCTNDNFYTINESEILAKIGDKIITINDFIKRSEYNVRPNYCNGNSIEAKQIILNSLIAEKLIAINDTTDLEESHLQILQGRKEQKMREVFYNRDIYNKVKLDSIELQKVYVNSQKNFKISYITLPEKETLEEIKNSLKDSIFTFEEVVKNLYHVNEIPTRNINFKEHVNENTYRNFFSNEIQLGQIYGPIFVDDYYSLFRVDDWVETRNISEIQRNNDLSNLKKSVKDLKAKIDYRLFVNSIMQGKNLRLHSENFDKLAINIDTEIGKLPMDKSEIEIRDISKNKKYSKNMLLDDIIFNISDKDWTLRDLNNLIILDPINIKRSQNKNNLKRKIKNLIIKKLETYYITQVAYDLVNQEKTIWTDYIKSSQVISNLINSSGEKFIGTDNKFFNEILNPLFDSLIEEYSDIVKVNINYFTDINISSIDMHAFFKQQSHSLVVPLFPIITNRKEIEYLN